MSLRDLEGRVFSLTLAALFRLSHDLHAEACDSRLVLRIAISWPTMARTVHGLSSDAHHHPSAQELASLVASAVQHSPAPDASPTPPLDNQDQNASIQSILAAARDLPQTSANSPHWPVQQFVMPPSSTAGPSTATRSVSFSYLRTPLSTGMLIGHVLGKHV